MLRYVRRSASLRALKVAPHVRQRRVCVVEATPSPSLETQPEVDVFEVRPKAGVVAADLLEGRPTKQRAGAGGREHMARFAVRGSARHAPADLPGPPQDVDVVAGRIQEMGVARLPDTRSDRPDGRLPAERRQGVLRPGWVEDGVVVDDAEVGRGRLRRSRIGRCGEERVVVHPDHAHRDFAVYRHPDDRSWRRVVDDDHLPRLHRLIGHRLEQPVEMRGAKRRDHETDICLWSRAV